MEKDTIQLLVTFDKNMIRPFKTMLYSLVMNNADETFMVWLLHAGVLFGASVTVTTENMKEVLSDDFVNQMYEKGAKAIIYVEFVPVTEEAKHLAPGDEEREFIKTELMRLRMEHDDMVLISFPGDEKTSGGCLAAGRGFFHINSHGGAEPCPFSPYSDINVKDIGVKEAINSPLFKEIQAQELLMEDHAGGCVLFERREQVEAILEAGR